MLRSSETKKGFTLVELMVSIAIFFIMTALLVANFGSFNSGVLLTDVAYDIALTLRTAQTYGLSVQGQGPVSNYSFTNPYGVALCAIPTCYGSNVMQAFTNQQVVLFADVAGAWTPPDGAFDSFDFPVPPSYTIQHGAKIVDICTGNGRTGCGNARVDITFLRPNPDAIICVSADTTLGMPNTCGGSSFAGSFVEIVVESPDGKDSYVTVDKTGQISVRNTP